MDGRAPGSPETAIAAAVARKQGEGRYNFHSMLTPRLATSYSSTADVLVGISA